jgi:serine/threonine-protein kinase
MTQTSAVIGTAQYLSPEQARGEAVDARSDVYATGCVLYELLTGQPPFVGDNPVSVAYQHVREDPRPPSDSSRDVTPDIDAVVLKALAKNRMNRYQSAAEMRGDVLRAASGRPVLATPVLREAETTPLPAPAPRLVGARSTGTMARVGGQRKRSSGPVLVALSILGILAVAALGTGLFLAGRPAESTVPPLTGLTSTEAQTALTSVKLQGAAQTVPGAQCTKGKVVDQTPAAGTKIAQGQTVNYTVCGGPETATVPQLKGLDQARAEAAVKAAGLVPVVNKIDGLVADKDKVIGVEPKEGDTVAKGATVQVHLSAGNQNIVPNIINLTYDQATGKLAEAGFTNIRKSINNAPGPGEAGRVTSQLPKAQSVAKMTDLVTIVVGATEAPPTSSTPSSTPTPTPT